MAAGYSPFSANSPKLTARPRGSSWPLPNFPIGISPVIWFDGNQAMFSDIAGTVPANIGDPLGRIVEVAPLASNWQAPTNAQRPRRDPYGARFDYVGSTNPAQSMQHTSTPSVDTTNCTLAISYVTRDAAGSPQQGLLRAGAFGLFAANGVTFATHSNGTQNWQPNIPLYVAGQRVTTVVRYTATGLKVWQYIDGVLSYDTLVTAVAGGASALPFILSNGAGADQGFYGSVAQALVFASALPDVDALSWAAWLDAQRTSEAYPLTAPLFAIGGDSIARDTPGPPAYQAWCWAALSNIRGTYPACEMVNVAVGGSGVDNAYSRIVTYYSAARARNVYVLATGTNNLASGNGDTYTINGLLREYDSALAAGWRPVIATILDRTGALSIPQATFDAQRATVNAAILASGRNIIDLTGVAGISANGSSAGANFIGDGVHPSAAGHALMEPLYRAQMLALAT